MQTLTLRRAGAADAAALLPLIEQLGYSLTQAQLDHTLSILLHDSHAHFMVAASDDNIHGFIQSNLKRTLIAGGYVEIVSLVVDESVRGQGVGGMLIESVKEWAKQQGVYKIRLGSRIHREQAHQFYEGLGFTRIKTQHWFEITL
ncbi:Histone acetyltransferase HPA2/related acetyltransferase [Hahella chejuensis KCTC 2396]|uniref:Histone acetyltransferase HPA2/related acetyltransferase n=1 Tax=Hahella chejuensis (strain KCTC 2396) TaxID=349521 RepID=Q2SA62_HAHCH|nr:GNAT family N-acetyltransferase [Hahella chejuensis]ABC32462.1 Histone acetyltransferase HPA2/related acetyltransferase [Hahella chejuensis KCTC 2396]